MHILTGIDCYPPAALRYRRRRSSPPPTLTCRPEPQPWRFPKDERFQPHCRYYHHRYRCRGLPQRHLFAVTG